VNKIYACDVTLSVYRHRAGLKNTPGHGGNRRFYSHRGNRQSQGTVHLLCRRGGGGGGGCLEKSSYFYRAPVEVIGKFSMLPPSKDAVRHPINKYRYGINIIILICNKVNIKKSKYIRKICCRWKLLINYGYFY
jgi:hypothetical protein